MKYWVLLGTKVFAGMTLFLFAVQLLKGWDWWEGLRYAASWALLSTSIFIGWQFFFSSATGSHCPMCDLIQSRGEKCKEK